MEAPPPAVGIFFSEIEFTKFKRELKPAILKSGVSQTTDISHITRGVAL